MGRRPFLRAAKPSKRADSDEALPFEREGRKGLVSVWDGVADPFVQTTCGARTSLQTQLSKAVGYHCRFSAASVSLKDWLLGYACQVYFFIY